MLADGRGYSDPVTEQPTALQAPLYTLLLAVVMKCGGGEMAMATLHVLLSTCTVWLSGVIALRSEVRWWWLPPLLVAIDPLVLARVTFAEAESCTAMLLAGLLLFVGQRDFDSRDSSFPQTGSASLLKRREFRLGLIFGLAAVCQPGIWCVAPVWYVGSRIARFRLGADSLPSLAKLVPAFLLGVGLLVVPWTLRNAYAMGSPIVGTTRVGLSMVRGSIGHSHYGIEDDLKDAGVLARAA